MTEEVVLEVPGGPDTRVYTEGWQSWSPATWYAADSDGLVPDEPWQHTMRFRPGTPLARSALQAEGLMVVDPGDGAPVTLVGTREAHDDVPTLRALRTGTTLQVTSSGPVETLSADTAAQALAAFGDDFARRAGARVADPPRVWCSWYRFFEEVTVADLSETLVQLDLHHLPVDVVQVDDGWSQGWGEWLSPRDGFGDLGALVDTVAATGRRTGLWLAPFLVGRDTSLAREHPDWLTGDAGRNWGQDLVGLDLTHPAVREHLHTTFARLRAAGVDYFKLDFLYGGALPGRNHADVSPVEAYRSGLRLVRAAVGDDAFVLGCGAPILPSVGLVDAMRVSPDTFHLAGQDGSAGLRGLMPVAARAWQQGRFWVNDPDCLVTRPSYRLRAEWARACATYGGLASFSDRIPELDEWGLATTRDLLTAGGSSLPFSPDVVREGAGIAAAEARARLSTATPGSLG